MERSGFTLRGETALSPLQGRIITCLEMRRDGPEEPVRIAAVWGACRLAVPELELAAGSRAGRDETRREPRQAAVKHCRVEGLVSL